MRNTICLYICIGAFVALQGCTEEIIREVGLHGTLKGTVYGSVPYAATLPLAGATVVLEGSEPLITLTTDGDGKFEANELVTGTYNLVVSKEGFGTYKIPGYSFVGGENPTLIGNITIFKLPNITIKNATVSVTELFNASRVTFNLLTESTNAEPGYGSFRYYLSSDETVSSSHYEETGILGSWSVPGQHTTRKDFLLSMYPAGSTFYVIIYPVTDQYSTYLDVETGKTVYASVGDSKSAVLKITIPN